MGRKKEYPGMLLYFDRIKGMIDNLEDAEIGQLFKAMYYYAYENKSPEFEDRALRLLWPELAFMIDRDKERYLEVSANNSYNAKIRVKDAGALLPDREEYVKNYKEKSAIVAKSVVQQKEDEERIRQDTEEKRRQDLISQIENYGK